MPCIGAAPIQGMVFLQLSPIPRLFNLIWSGLVSARLPFINYLASLICLTASSAAFAEALSFILSRNCLICFSTSIS